MALSWCACAANFANDSVEIGVLVANFRNWVRVQALQDNLANMKVG